MAIGTSFSQKIICQVGIKENYQQDDVTRRWTDQLHKSVLLIAAVG
jgi:hypothetical protein